MIGVQQPTPKSCYATCVASILEVSADEVPCIWEDYDTGDWFVDWNIDLVKKFNAHVIEFKKEILYNTWMYFTGHWIATVPSLNIPYANHCVVMKGDSVIWDPSTKKTYEIGIKDSEFEIYMLSFVVPVL